MKIVYFIDHLRPDGTQHVLTQLAEGLAARGHQQAVVCLNDSTDERVGEKLRSAGCEIRIIGKRALFSGIGAAATRSWLKKNRFDVAVTMLFAADVFGRVIARTAGVERVVSSIRARNINYKPWQRWMVKRTSKLTDIVVINSQGITDFAIQEEGVSAHQICFIPNGIALSGNGRLDSRLDIREELKLGPQSILIGTAGRLTYQKGIDVLLKAAALSHVQDMHLLIMGEGELKGELVDLAESSGLGGRVHFLGYRDDLPRLLSELDVYVQPSRFEGMSNALMEAMAIGCPVVATAVDGNIELVEHGVTGLLFTNDQPESLKTALVTLIENRDVARQFAYAARSKIASSYSLSEMIFAWERVLAGDSRPNCTSIDRNNKSI